MLSIDNVVDILNKTVLNRRLAPWILAALIYRGTASTLGSSPDVQQVLSAIWGAIRSNGWISLYAFIVTTRLVNSAMHKLVIDRAARREIQWSEQVVVIPGGSGGIGGGVAKSLVAKGAKVAVLDLQERLDQSAGLFIKCDITSDESVNNAYQVVKKTYGSATMILHSAGIGIKAPMVLANGDVTNAAIEKVYGVNLFGPIRVNRTFAQEMIKNNKGHIFFICSGASWISLPLNGAYNGSKAALWSVYETTQFELDTIYNATGVRTSAICPLRVETELTKGTMASSSNQFMVPDQTIDGVAKRIVNVLESDKSTVVLSPAFMNVLVHVRSWPAWFQRAFFKRSKASETFVSGDEPYLARKK